MEEELKVPFVMDENEMRDLMQIAKEHEGALARAVRRINEQGEDVCKFNSFAH